MATLLAPAPAPVLSGRPAHVVAVLPDSAEAVDVARAAAEVALACDRPLALVVPVAGPGFTLDPTELAAGCARIAEDTAAVAARLRAEAVLVPTDLPAAAHLRLPAGVLRPVGPGGSPAGAGDAAAART